jgi:hypothetical protein
VKVEGRLLAIAVKARSHGKSTVEKAGGFKHEAIHFLACGRDIRRDHASKIGRALVA